MADVTGAGVGDGRVMRGATEEDVEGGRRGGGRRGDQLDGGRGVSESVGAPSDLCSALDDLLPRNRQAGVMSTYVTG